MLHVEVIQDEWTPILREYRKRWQSLSPIERDISRIVQESIRSNYLTEGGHSGMRWSPRTRPYPWPPLRKSGHMFGLQQITAVGQFEKQGDTHVLDFTDVIYNSTPYARFHHTGTRFMPARPTLRLSEADESMITEKIGEYIFLDQ